jgi:hypothetical protein
MGEPGHDARAGATASRRMLCSGTGGPRKVGVRGLTCPVCGKDDFTGYPDTRRVVPRHFVNVSTSTAAPGTGTAASDEASTATVNA